jgi:hypothetical protein
MLDELPLDMKLSIDWLCVLESDLLPYKGQLIKLICREPWLMAIVAEHSN